MKQLSGHIQNISIRDHTYELPGNRIAAYPLKQRDTSRLLVYEDGSIHDSLFNQLADFLEPGSLMLFNNTRVVQARLEFYKTTGARIEIFCLNPIKPVLDMQQALAQTGSVSWLALVGNAKKWKSGALEIKNPDGSFSLRAHLVEQSGDGYIVNFDWSPGALSFGEVLETVGKTPLPPYIARPAEDNDKRDYQCVYALNEGSVAAPTAGLHFTPAVMEELVNNGIDTAFLTLHVGAGTFKPVSGETIDSHTMHSEEFSISTELVKKIADHLSNSSSASLAHGMSAEKPAKIICVGTTSMRTLESLYWLGAQILQGLSPDNETLHLEQWAPYRLEESTPEPAKALVALFNWARSKKINYIKGTTALMIVPGYSFQLTDVLVTNFHLPGSTLLLLVSAFVGQGWKDVYKHALANEYRFLSYGDACLLFRKKIITEDIFGVALNDFMDGYSDGIIDVRTKLSGFSEKEELPVSYFFRTLDQMPEWERIALDVCEGHVLDAGAGAGAHALELQRRGHTVAAIDISAGAADVMKKRGVQKAICASFLDFTGGKFDTILFLMNGIGMAANLHGLRAVLKHAGDLLAPGGKIILESTDILYMYREEDGSVLLPLGNNYYGEVEYRLSYREYSSKAFPWLFVDIDNLCSVAGECGYDTNILYQGETDNYLAMLTLRA